MNNPDPESDKMRSPTSDFTQAIGNKEQRKIHARQTKPDGGVWFGLGFTGLIGWSTVAPTMLGMAIGAWLDRQYPSRLSWTLALMLGGLTLGCLVAWEWVSQEQERMAKSQPPDDDSPSLEDGVAHIHNETPVKQKNE
ncbi:AtpZ/AtpI family protein [Microcoleus sp.]|uniref:AtpZ/AtpI family protein n=1 Tax=Microcoleus sp. TaxID=44472 RepID=UPI003594497A